MAMENPNIGKALVKALTERQLVHLLDLVASPNVLQGLRDELVETDPDMADTIEKLLGVMKGPRVEESPVDTITSAERTLEAWDELWRRWGEIVGDVGDEEGEYANQDNHWEPAYFDGYALAADLEPIGETMLALIPQVHAQVNDAELFFNAFGEIEAGIELYPEWMGAADGDPVVLGPMVTRCALEWSWLEARYGDDPGIVFVSEVVEMENVAEIVELDDATCEAFLIGLPEDVCRSIFVSLNKSNREVDTTNPYSFWHRVKHDYEARFDPGQYLETCRAHLSDNWQYGLPLIEAAIESEAFEDAERLLTETLSTFLRRDRDNPWVPEASLIFVEMSRFYHKHTEGIDTLLSKWVEVAQAMGNQLRQAAVKFQRVVVRDSQHLETVIDAYNRISDRPTQQKLAPLFDQWENAVAAQSLSYNVSLEDTTETWIHWMIDAGMGGRYDAKSFMAQCRAWLKLLHDKPEAFKRGWHWLAVLTVDLPQGRDLLKQHPTFGQQVLSWGQSEDQLTHARRAMLQKMNPEPLFDAAMAVWRRRLREIVPDPDTAHKSLYDSQVRWAQCLYEINPEQYQHLLASWRQQHGLKRNLWRDMKGAGLPV